jgi:hypothetical protein
MINRFFSAESTRSDTWDQGLREFDDDLRYRRELDCPSADHPGGLRLLRGKNYPAILGLWGHRALDQRAPLY